MFKNLPFLLVLMFSFLPTLANASPAADAVIEQARANCRSFETGKMIVEAGAIAHIDISGDGVPDEIINARYFTCGTTESYACGSGGCAITVIIDGNPTEFFAKAYKVIVWHNQPILLLSIHGNACNGTGIRRCYDAHVWSEGAFRNPGTS